MLRFAAMAAKWHEPPKDALDTLVLGQARCRSLPPLFCRPLPLCLQHHCSVSGVLCPVSGVRCPGFSARRLPLSIRRPLPAACCPPIAPACCPPPPAAACGPLTAGRRGRIQVDIASLEGYEHTDYMPFDPIFKRTEGSLKGPDGELFKTSKGAPHIICKLDSRAEVQAAVNKKARHSSARLSARSGALRLASTAPRPVYARD